MKRLIALLLILITCSGFCLAENRSEWNDSIEYSYGIVVRQANGDFLPHAPIEASYLEEGIKITVINDMPCDDVCSLVFVLNEKVQPFVLDDETMTEVVFAIEAKSSREFDIRFDHLNAGTTEVQYLHAIAAGLLTSMPKNKSDYFDIYSTICTMPFIGQTDNDVQNTNVLTEVEVDNKLYNAALEHGVRASFSKAINENGFVLRDAVERYSAQMPLEVSLLEPDTHVSVLLLIDGVPWQSDAFLPAGCSSANCALQAHYDLSDLDPGDHLVYGLVLPTFNYVDMPDLTHRLKLTISAQR